MKMLYILNIANKVNSFSHASMLAARECNIEFHIAGNWGYQTSEEREDDEKKYGIRIHQVDFIRTPYDPRNYKAYRQLAKIVEGEKFDIIHCNTPTGGVLGRLVAKRYGVKKLIYQAHGFHFYKGAPLLNWILYYPIEKCLARYTDALITISQEDYCVARERFALKNDGKAYLVHGVGIELSEFAGIKVSRCSIREELGLADEDVMLISAGDLVRRKNYTTAIKAIEEAGNGNLQYFICGNGPEQQNLKNLTRELRLENQIHFLGFRSDVKELMAASDIFLFTTFQEGLPRSMMEAMASGLPCIASKIRGNTDLVEDGVNGYLFDPKDVNGFAAAIAALVDNEELRRSMSHLNIERIKSFDISVVEKKIYEIYREVLNEIE